MMTKWKVLAKQRPEAGLGSPVKQLHSFTR